MMNYRQLIAILACISLSGCITYSNDEYYSSPGNAVYESDDYYADPDLYNGNYGQYVYYGYQPSVVFNINIGYGFGYPGFYYPMYGYYPGNYGYQNCNAWSSYCYAFRPNYGWGYWPVYEYRPHHHHHNPKPPRDHHNPPGDHDDQDNDEVLIGDDYPNTNGTRPMPRPGAPGHLVNQGRTPVIYNGNGGFVRANPKPIQPAPVKRPIVVDGPNVVDDNDSIRPPKHYAQQPKPVRANRPMQVDEIDVDMDAELYNVRIYNAQQPSPNYRAKPMPQDQVQHVRRQYQADKNSDGQPESADVTPQYYLNSNYGTTPKKQPKPSHQGNPQKSESRQPKPSKEDGDD